MCVAYVMDLWQGTAVAVVLAAVVFVAIHVVVALVAAVGLGRQTMFGAEADGLSRMYYISMHGGGRVSFRAMVSSVFMSRDGLVQVSFVRMRAPGIKARKAVVVSVNNKGVHGRKAYLDVAVPDEWYDDFGRRDSEIYRIVRDAVGDVEAMRMAVDVAVYSKLLKRYG